MVRAPHASGVRRKSRGRPAGTKVFSDVLPLFEELQRVTGCPPRRLLESFDRIFTELKRRKKIPKGRIHNKCDLPSVSTLRDGFVGAGFRKGNEPRKGDDRSPEWFALHVTEAILGRGEPCELAIFWEPFSRVVFARLAPTFNPEKETRELIDFVTTSLGSLPPEYSKHLSTAWLTRPVSAAADSKFWYALKSTDLGGGDSGDTPRDRSLRKALSGKIRVIKVDGVDGVDDKKVKIRNAQISAGYAPVDFTPFTGAITFKAAWRSVRDWRNAYNLCHPEKDKVLILGASTGKFNPSDLQADRRFFEGANMKAPPQRRLKAALGLKPGPGVKALRKSLCRTK